MRVAVLVPCYKRPEYTEKCIKALEKAQDYKETDFYLYDDGSNDTTSEILSSSKLPNKVVTIHPENVGLRNTIIEFFNAVELLGYDLLVKMDNDCAVPPNWLQDLISKFQNTNAEILSPNILPSNAAFKYGSDDKGGLGYRPSSLVGGLWAMKKSMIDGIDFESFSIDGIRGAFHLLNQIIMEKEPRIGWASDITVQDMGHWTGDHPEHIKSEDHYIYSIQIGRPVAWNISSEMTT